MQSSDPSLHSVEQAIHQAGQAHAEMHELPNLLTILDKIYPQNPFIHFLHQWENIFFSLFVAVLISFFAVKAARKKNLVPERGIQNFCEIVVEAIDGFVAGILGAQGRNYVPYLGTLFIYILLMNWSGLVPFLKSPTSSWSIPVALALTTMVYVQITGIREQGLGHYLTHMAGNPKNIFGFILIPLMLVINMTIEFFAVPLSLSLRLFANVSSEDRLLLKFAELNVLFNGLPFFFQLFANVLAIMFSIVQAFVFMLLATVYISLILPHDHHEEKNRDEATGHPEIASGTLK